MVKQGAARAGELHPLLSAGEQGNADRLLQSPHTAGQPLAGQIEALGSLGDVAGGDQLVEVAALLGG